MRDGRRSPAGPQQGDGGGDQQAREGGEGDGKVEAVGDDADERRPEAADPEKQRPGGAEVRAGVGVRGGVEQDGVDDGKLGLVGEGEGDDGGGDGGGGVADE